MTANPGRRPRRGLNSISNKLLAVLVAVAVLPAVTVAIYALHKGTESLADQALTLLVDTALSDAAHTEDVLERAQDELVDVTLNGQVRATFSLLSRPLDDQSQPVSLTPAEVETLRDYMTWLAGYLEDYLSLRPEATSVLVVSNQVHKSLPVLRVERVNDDLQTQALIDFTERGDLAERPLPPHRLDESLKRLREVVQRHPHRLTHRTTIRAAEGETLEVFMVSVRDDKELPIGRVMLTLSWPHILRDLCAGTTVTREEPLPIRSTLYDAELRTLQDSHPGQPVVLPDEMVGHARRGMASAVMTSKDEIVSFAPLVHPYEPGVFSVLAFSRPTSQEFAGVARFRYVFAGVLAAALLLALGLGTYWSRRMTRPLRELRDGARRIGAGELAQALAVRTGDEVEDVAAEFNSMAGKLRSLYEGMEATISDRTEQLQGALTDLREAHRKIVESEARYSDIVENASDLIQVTDTEGRLLSVNRRQAELLQCSVEDLTGKDFFQFVAEDVRDGTRRGFDSVLSGRTLDAFPSALSGGEGHRVPLEISATPVHRDDRIVGVRAILRDVSQRKAMEAQLIRAERLSSVGALAAGVAHEINNPLGIITMFAQRTLEKARGGEVDTDKLEKIVTQAKRVAQITQGLLDFSRAAPAEYAPMDLAEVLRETAALVEERARRNAITLTLEVPDGLPPVFGNARQIGQVCLNLLLNAMQAIGSDGRIEVRAETVTRSRLREAGPAVRVAVQDSGPGIPEEVLPQLFEPFFTTKAPGEGTGLGLSVSYGILKEHHGILTARNSQSGADSQDSPPTGAVFEFELPAHRPARKE